jgi:glycosyltransferase involved in cell wall biosynthesis
LGTLVQAASDLRTERVTFVLVGQGPSESELRWRVDDLRLENVAILPPVPKHAVRPLLQLCDAGIQGFTDLPIYRCGVSPNKVFDYLSAGLPVILAASTPSNPVGASGGGIVVSPGSAAGIAEAVRTLCRMSPDARRAMGLRGREHVARHHDLGHVAHRYLDLFVRLRQGGPRNTTEDDLAGTRN